MTIDMHRRGQVEVLTLSGGPLGDEDAASLRLELERRLIAGGFLFIIDLGGVDRVGSAFLGELVAGRERVRKQDGTMKLVASARVRDQLVLAWLDRLFEIYRDEEEALDSFVGESATAGIP